MDPNIVVALIASGASVTVTSLTAFFSLLNLRHSKEIKDQVKNSHESNLREDIDEIKTGLIQLQDLFTRRVVHHDEIHERMWRSINRKAPQ